MKKLKSCIGFVLVIVTLSLVLSSCGNASTKESTCNTHAIARDMSGMDACGMLLELDNGDKVQPENLEDFKMTLKDGEAVTIGFEFAKDKLSACMAGKVITLKCIEKGK